MEYIDFEFYSTQTEVDFSTKKSAAKHFLRYALSNRLDPSHAFSTDRYLKDFPDVESSGMNPLIHYINYGWRENRHIYSSDGLVTELITFKSYKVDGSGPRPFTIGCELKWENRINGWANNPSGEIDFVKLIYDGKLIDIAKPSQAQNQYSNYGNLVNLAFVFHLGPDHINKPPDKFLITGKEGNHRFQARISMDKALCPQKDLDSFFSQSNQAQAISGILPCSEQLVSEFKLSLQQYLNCNPVKKSTAPLVSIIMPAYNRENQISAAIESLSHQTWKNWELILVDDGSTDDTLTTAKNTMERLGILGRCHIFKSDLNQGVSKARNLALSNCRGEYIAYLDSDNTWEPDFLRCVVQKLNEEENLASVYSGQRIYRYNRTTGQQYSVGIRSPLYDYEKLQEENYIDLNAFAHRRYLYKKYGGFNEEMRRLVDWELIKRYSKAQAPKLIPFLLSNYFIENSDNQITNHEEYFHNYSLAKNSQ